MKRPTLLAAAVALAVAGTLAFGALPASAAVPTADTPPIPGALPIKGKAKLYMLNVLGSVLKGATPQKWKREQLALANTYNHGFEELDLQYGYAGIGNWGDTPPSTIEEYNMKRLELGVKGSVLGRNGKPIGNGSVYRPPAVKGGAVQKIVNGIGTGVAIISAAETGFAIGKAAAGAMGFNVEGGLCGSTPNDFGSTMVGLITATDCQAYWDFAADYVPNVDVDKLSRGGRCTQPDGYNPASGDGKDWRAVPANCRTMLVYLTQNAETVAGSVWLDTFTNIAPRAWTVKYTWSVTAPPLGTITGPSVTGVCLNATTGKWGAQSGTQGAVFSPMASANTDGANATVTRSATLSYTCPTASPLLVLSLSSTYTITGVTGFKKNQGIMVGAQGDIVAADMSGDPERTWKCVMTYTDGTTASKQGTVWRESAKETPPFECPGAGGKIPAHIDVYKHGVVDGTDVLWYSEDTTDEYQDSAEKNPECQDGSCKLDLLIKATGQSCFDNEEACATWFEEADKVTKYQCTYGGKNVDQSECYVYSGLFDPERQAVGAPYSDPETGLWSGGQSAPSISEGIMGQKIQNPEVARNCLPTGWGVVNPLEWVTKPVQCAMEWAFVPRQTVVNLEAERIKTQWNGKMPAQLAGTVGSWNLAPHATGCEKSATLFGITFDVWNACPGTPMGNISWIAKLVTGALMVTLGVIVFRRIIGGMFFKAS